MKRSRRNHSPAFKAKVALQAIRGDKTLRDARRRLSSRSAPRPSASNLIVAVPIQVCRWS